MTDDLSYAYTPPTHSETLGKLAAAKARAQIKFTPLGKDKSANIGSKYSYSYADLAACLESVVPALSEEGIALFTPVRVDGNRAIATTLLVHGESGEWYASEFACQIVDLTDARSVGSASTYARRYGLCSTLGIASTDEDDDAEAARGGDHEMKKPGAAACPACGVVGSVIKGKPEYGGGWLCWPKQGGCGMKWPDGPFPTTVPPIDDEFTPKQRSDAASKLTSGGGTPGRVKSASVRPEPTLSAVPASDILPAPSAGNTSGGGLASSAPPDAGSTKQERKPKDVPVVDLKTGQEVKSGESSGPRVFTIGHAKYETKGMTEEQMRASFDLVVRADKKVRKGYARECLAKILGCDPATASRNNATEAQATQWLDTLQSAVEG